MWKWLRSWFAWRFSLTRLVVAVVFLGAFVGLNLRTIGPMDLYRDVRLDGRTLYADYHRGWPLPFVKDGSRPTENEFVDWELLMDAAASYRLPLSHRTYRMLEWSWFPSAFQPHGLIYFAIINALFALSVLALILFLQIPRRKEAAKVE